MDLAARQVRVRLGLGLGSEEVLMDLAARQVCQLQELTTKP